MKNQRGYTLIELMVTFVLIGIFMTAAASVMASFTRIFLEVKTAANAQTLSDILLSVIDGEVSQAQNKGISSIIITQGDNGLDTLNYTTQKGVPAQMGIMRENKISEDTRLLIQADKLTGHELNIHFAYNIAGAVSGESFETVTDWYYGRSAYMGLRITQLEFDKLGNGVLRVNLTLRSNKTGYEYSSYRVVKCINVPEEMIDIVPGTG